MVVLFNKSKIYHVQLEEVVIVFIIWIILVDCCPQNLLPQIYSLSFPSLWLCKQHLLHAILCLLKISVTPIGRGLTGWGYLVILYPPTLNHKFVLFVCLFLLHATYFNL